MISAIVAVDENFGIGFNNQLLEHIPEDLKRFKQIKQLLWEEKLGSLYQINLFQID